MDNPAPSCRARRFEHTLSPLGVDPPEFIPADGRRPERRGEMKKDVGSLQNPAQKLLVTDISLPRLNLDAGPKRAAVDERPDLEPAGDERLHKMAADDPRSSGDESRHRLC